MRTLWNKYHIHNTHAHTEATHKTPFVFFICLHWRYTQFIYSESAVDLYLTEWNLKWTRITFEENRKLSLSGHICANRHFLFSRIFLAFLFEMIKILFLKWWSHVKFYANISCDPNIFDLILFRNAKEFSFFWAYLHFFSSEFSIFLPIFTNSYDKLIEMLMVMKLLPIFFHNFQCYFMWFNLFPEQKQCQLEKLHNFLVQIRYILRKQ